MIQDKAHPTPTAVPSEREAFEAWADAQGFRLERVIQGDDYQDLRTQGPWEAWQVRALAAPVASPEPKQEGALLMALAVIREITGTQQENIEATVDAVQSLAAPVASNTTAEPAPIQPAGVEVERDAARYRWLRDRAPWTLISSNGITRLAARLPIEMKADTDGADDMDAAIDLALAGGAAK